MASYLPITLPAVVPTLDDRQFWKNCNERVLAFEACGNCGKFRHPPRPMCPSCHSLDTKWVRAPDVATVFTYTEVRHPAHASLQDVVPYNVAVVEFGAPFSIRLITNIVDARPGELAIGMPVTLAWEEGGGGQLLPRFRALR